VHAPSEESDDTKDSFYDKLKCVLNQVPRNRTKIPLGDFNANVRKDYIFRQTNKDESLQKISNDNGVRIVNLATSKNLSTV
jgi:hypothetical protein